MKTSLYYLIVLIAPFFSENDQNGLSKAERKAILKAHNFWREDVGVTEKLIWSNGLAVVAAEWAKALKDKNCGFEHRPDNPYGENLFKGTTGYFGEKQVVDAWASEKSYYNYHKNDCTPGEMCGHYTQIVWQNTQRVGCAKIQCDDMDIWVCEYDPPGNWVGQKPY